MPRDREEGKRRQGTNPDRGPPMMEGAHQFDKGYDSDPNVFDRNTSYPDDHQRGNPYVKLNKEIISRDTKKLNRGHFTKIA